MQQFAQEATGGRQLSLFVMCRWLPLRKRNADALVRAAEGFERDRTAVVDVAQSANHADPVDVAAARQYLAEAANDQRITLAARELREVPDEEICRLYLQLKH